MIVNFHTESHLSQTFLNKLILFRVLGVPQKDLGLQGESKSQMFYHYYGLPRDPITERQRMIGVYHHLRNARYLASNTVSVF